MVVPVRAARARTARAGAGLPARLAALFAGLLVVASATGQDGAPAPRAREAGIVVGVFQPGAENAITDVAGVRVGHATVRGAHGNTGVTAILPPGEDWFHARVPAAIVVGNGFGKLVGATQVGELGELETPILLTCTLCVWKAADAMVEWMLARPGMQEVRSVNPVVGETNDAALNDIRSRPITAAHVVAALGSASGGRVEEGAVGAGAGTVAFGWKGGIGTSSRVLPTAMGGYVIGVLVQSNFGGHLSIGGAPVWRELRPDEAQDEEPTPDGSIMIVVATDAPLGQAGLTRLARRALFGLARTGSSMSNGSGDYVIAFSTADAVRRRPGGRTRQGVEVANDAMTPLFQAVAEATEEAIYNSLFQAVTTSFGETTVEALPLQRTLEVLRAHGVVPAAGAAGTPQP